jgi:hypothetical protein
MFEVKDANLSLKKRATKGDEGTVFTSGLDECKASRFGRYNCGETAFGTYSDIRANIVGDVLQFLEYRSMIYFYGLNLPVALFTPRTEHSCLKPTKVMCSSGEKQSGLVIVFEALCYKSEGREFETR